LSATFSDEFRHQDMKLLGICKFFKGIQTLRNFYF